MLKKFSPVISNRICLFCKKGVFICSVLCWIYILCIKPLLNKAAYAFGFGIIKISYYSRII